jgi:hypothetical protein
MVGYDAKLPGSDAFRKHGTPGMRCFAGTVLEWQSYSGDKRMASAIPSTFTPDLKRMHFLP